MPDFVTGSIGTLLIVGGVLMIFVFPAEESYQSHAFGVTGILIGVAMLAIGIGLWVFT